MKKEKAAFILWKFYKLSEQFSKDNNLKFDSKTKEKLVELINYQTQTDVKLSWIEGKIK